MKYGKVDNKSLSIHGMREWAELYFLFFSCPLISTLLRHSLWQPLVFNLWLRSGVGSRWRSTRLCACNSRIDLLLANLLSRTHSSGNLRGDRDPLNAGLWRGRERDSSFKCRYYEVLTGVEGRLTKARRAFANSGLRVILLIKALAPRIGGQFGKEPCRNRTDYNDRCEHPAQDTKSEDTPRDEPRTPVR